ncbi:hypothetical protein [Micromonospora zamorensis]|uniref:hypothetical protein n=1 Tax=Micromonospora zamorensis TaxID=709883 RepID=UPI003CFB14C2
MSHGPDEGNPRLDEEVREAERRLGDDAKPSDDAQTDDAQTDDAQTDDALTDDDARVPDDARSEQDPGA